MKIFYDHIYGNTTKYDIIYSLALSEVDKGEEDKARPCAKEWVEKSFGKDTDWSLHQVYEK